MFTTKTEMGYGLMTDLGLSVQIRTIHGLFTHYIRTIAIPDSQERYTIALTFLSAIARCAILFALQNYLF